MPEIAKREMLPNELLSYFLHQDRMMWSRLQTLLAIEGVTLACALKMQESKTSMIILMIFGAVLSVLVIMLFYRDRQYRRFYSDRLAALVSTEVYLPDWKVLKIIINGHRVFWAILVLFAIGNALVLIDVCKSFR